jgi:lipopolysaccharide transport system permease protein
MTPALATELGLLWRLRGLLAVLTRRELAARFAGSAGGVLWVWLPPLLTVGSYYLVFDVVFGMRLGAQAPTGRVGTYLIVGMLAWMAFVDGAQRGMASLLDAGGMLQKNPLPPGLFPARSVLASVVVFVTVAPVPETICEELSPHTELWSTVAAVPLAS